MAKTASISMEIDSGIKGRAMAVLEARGMSLSGAVRRMVTLGEPGAPHPLRGDARPGVRRGGHERRPGEAMRHRQGGARQDRRPHRHGGEDGAGVQARDEAVLLRHVRDAQRPRTHIPGTGRLRAARTIRRLRGARHLESRRPSPRARMGNQR